jgi:hypothetical protein
MSGLLALFTVTVFLSATLLFSVQPMFGRMILPMFGGAPAVWNASVVFFQLALLAGYAYVHLTIKWLGVRRQAVLHLLVLLAPLALLPIRARSGWWPPTPMHPLSSVFLVLVISVGFPFFVVSTSAPLLQRWFGGTTDTSARDPFFLYAASNAGSLGALLAYPFLIEPALRLGTQSRVWAAGYGLLALLTAACARVVWRSSEETVHEVIEESAPLTWGERLRWLALAAVPSSLMLSVTTYISTDIAAVPLLWVMPLSIYLLTFVIAFARRQFVSQRFLGALLPVAVLPPLVSIIGDRTDNLWTIPIHLFTLFVAALFCHGELARTRPGVSRLTEFYVWMSVGGAVGGLFNTLLAPVLFRTTAEYPLGIVLACLLRPAPVVEHPRATPTAGDGRGWRARWYRLWNIGAPVADGAVDDDALRLQRRRERWLDVGLPFLIGILVLFLQASAQVVHRYPGSYGYLAHVFALPCALCLAFWRRPLRLGLGLGAVVLFAGLYPISAEEVLYTERSFYGVHRVVNRGTTRLLLHGTTNHGAQSLDPENKCLPLTYYYPTGPFGQIFDSFQGDFAKQRIAVVGLGTGSSSSYTRAGEQWTFFEINPTVERIARDPRFFTILRDCAENPRVIIGDARMSLAAQPDAAYDVMVFDAFSSDAIPLHLMTREALEMYLHKLSAHGVLVFHISNRYLDLSPILAGLAAEQQMVAYQNDDLRVTIGESYRGKTTSSWVVLARSKADLGPLTDNTRWVPISANPRVRPWTDDYSNILSVLDW